MPGQEVQFVLRVDAGGKGPPRNGFEVTGRKLRPGVVREAARHANRLALLANLKSAQRTAPQH
jgi:hypothetical protein